MVRDLERLVILRENEKIEREVKNQNTIYSHTDPGPGATKQRKIDALKGMKVYGKGVNKNKLVTSRIYWIRRERRRYLPERQWRVALAKRRYDEAATSTIGEFNTPSSLKILDSLPARGVITDPEVPMRGLDSFPPRVVDPFSVQLTMHAPPSPVASELEASEIWFSSSGSEPSDLAIETDLSESSHSFLNTYSPPPDSSSTESDPSELPLDPSSSEVDPVDYYVETEPSECSVEIDSSPYPIDSESPAHTTWTDISEHTDPDAEGDSAGHLSSGDE